MGRLLAHEYIIKKFDKIIKDSFYDEPAINDKIILSFKDRDIKEDQMLNIDWESSYFIFFFGQWMDRMGSKVLISGSHKETFNSYTEFYDFLSKLYEKTYDHHAHHVMQHYLCTLCIKTYEGWEHDFPPFLEQEPYDLKAFLDWDSFSGGLREVVMLNGGYLTNPLYFLDQLEEIDKKKNKKTKKKSK